MEKTEFVYIVDYIENDEKAVYRSLNTAKLRMISRLLDEASKWTDYSMSNLIEDIRCVINHNCITDYAYLSEEPIIE